MTDFSTGQPVLTSVYAPPPGIMADGLSSASLQQISGPGPNDRRHDGGTHGVGDDLPVGRVGGDRVEEGGAQRRLLAGRVQHRVQLAGVAETKVSRRMA